MPGLMRSKSMRLLKGYRKDAAQQEQTRDSMPRPDASQTANDRYQSATPISRAEETSETPDMAVRPSTSGGPGDRRTHFHMKTNPVPSTYSQNDLNSYLPTKSTTILYTAEVTDSREGIIGIALGSPTVGSHWNTTPQAETFSADVHGTKDQMPAFSHPNNSPATTIGHHPKTKLSRWRSLFKKAGPTPSTPDKSSFYQLTQNVTTTRAARADSHQDDESVDSRVTSKKEWEAGRTSSPSTYKADIRASRISPSDRSSPGASAFTAGNIPTNPRASVKRSVTTPNPPLSHRTYDSSFVPQLVVSKSGRVASAPEDKPLLDISIPDITMERYSVMFGNLLESTPSRSSLLVRRQGNAEKLKPLNKLSVKEEEQEYLMDYKLQRRATSPRVSSPSPRLSLFPSAGNCRAASPLSMSVSLSRPLHRSKTAPEKSPLRQIFSRNEHEIAKGRELFLNKPAATPSRKPQPLAIKPPSMHSFESEADSVTITVAQASPGLPQRVRIDEREPDWEVCAKPVAVSQLETTNTPGVARTDSQWQPKVTKFTALSSNPSSAPLDVPSPLQRISSLRSPLMSANRTHEIHTSGETRKEKGDAAGKAMVGVARSISVSRAQSPRTLIRTATDASSPERFVERQALMPTMVEVRNRRSQRVQLEDA